ncbi:MAG: methyltransferase domain-containing protein [Defluviitaleaceae bacterium]|nr:methyltransferase domain-containing protein [Defluviitaleaceae bacterium]
MGKKAEFDKLANSYDNWHADLIKGSGFSREYFLEYKVKEVARILTEKNFTPKNILDFGCGVGDVEPYLQKYFPEANIFGVDISQESIETAKSKGYKNISFAPLDENWIESDALSQFNTVYDIVFIAGVFHHAPKDEHFKILSAIKSNLTQNAKIFIFELNPYNPATRYVFAKHEKPVDRNANLLPPRHIKKILQNLGFRTSRSIYTIFFPSALKIFIPLEKYLSRIPLGAHYYILGEEF